MINMEYVRAEMRYMPDCSRASTHACTHVLSHLHSLLRPHSCWPLLSPTFAVSLYLCSSTQPKNAPLVSSGWSWSQGNTILRCGFSHHGDFNGTCAAANSKQIRSLTFTVLMMNSHSHTHIHNPLTHLYIFTHTPICHCNTSPTLKS